MEDPDLGLGGKRDGGHGLDGLWHLIPAGDGEEHPLEVRVAVLLGARRDDENRAGKPLEHPVADATEEKSPEVGAAAGADGDEVGRVLTGCVRDHIRDFCRTSA